MKPLKGVQQLQSVSLSYYVTLQALKPKSSPRRRRGLDASTHRGLTERSGEVFLLDILSHRMSEIACFRQLSRYPTYTLCHGCGLAVDFATVRDVDHVGDFGPLLFGRTRRGCRWPSI